MATSSRTISPSAFVVGAAGATLVSVGGSVADALALAPRTLPEGEALSDGEALPDADSLADADASVDAEGLAASAPLVTAPNATATTTRARAGTASRGPRRGADGWEWDMHNLLSAAGHSPVGRPPPD